MKATLTVLGSGTSMGVPTSGCDGLVCRSSDPRDKRTRPSVLIHGEAEIYGFRFGSAAYLTDHSVIPESSLAQLQGLDVLFLDALRYKPHPTHSTVENSLHTVERLKPRRAFFTHICHDLPHEETNANLPENVKLSYDGMKLEFEI